jgi:hypothetical protein
MSSLADLFSPTFLIYLGILVLVISLLVVYFESKLRDQNHKISSMLSLVSTLADDLNSVKFGLNHLALNLNNTSQPLEESIKTFNIKENNELISVSDDDDDEYDDDYEELEDEDEDEDEDEVSIEEDLEEDDDVEDEINLKENNLEDLIIDDKNNIKILKINILQNEDLQNEDLQKNNLELTEISQDLANKENESLVFENNENTFDSTFKINLEENSIIDNHDYKNLSIQKLRRIVTDKGLSQESSKLKKPELLKLLGFE